MRPRSPDPRAVTPADLAACRALLRGGSRTFFAASLLLPARVSERASSLYAFCRLADDAVDLDTHPLHALAGLRERLDRIYGGQPLKHAADRALAGVVERYHVPRALLDGLLEGFEWDAAARRYADLSGVYAYSARVAGAVGAMMAILMGVRSPDAVARACDLGVAMQLTNIARDVGEDARAGRLYLPLDWLREAGIDPDAWLARPAFSPALGAVIDRLLRAADVLYQRAEAGIAQLPGDCRPGIYAARLLYAEIGNELRRRGFDSVSRRAVVPIQRKAWLVGRAVAQLARAKPGASFPPLEETRFLVEAAAAAPVPPQSPGAALENVPWWKLYDRGVWLIGLFERLERRAQVQRERG